MAAKTKSGSIDLPALQVEAVTLTLIGDTPLICHAWSQKAKAQMLAKQMKKASAGRAAKNPWMDFCESLYWLDGMPEEPTEADVESGRFGVPAIAFKSAAVTGCTSVATVTKIAARQAFHIDDEFVEIEGPPPSMREDICRVGMGTADLRYRGEFDPWRVRLTVKFNAGLMSAEQVVNAFQVAGFAVGVCEWRPERDGNFGRFHVASREEAEA